MEILKKYKKNSLIIFILLLAAYLRIFRIADYMTFLGDEGRDVLVAYNILHGHFTLLGPTSSVGGFFLGPIYYYFMAPFLWIFNYNPVGPAIMVALFGIATVFLVYKIGKDIFSKATGLIAAFLYSISPVVISYSRSSWNPNLMPFFTIITLYFIYKAEVYFNYLKKAKDEKIINNFLHLPNKVILFFLASGFFLGILIQLHYLATFVGGIIFVYVLILGVFNKNDKSWNLKIINILKKYLIIFVGFLIGLSPYLAFEARHGFPNTISIFKFIFHSPEVSGNGNFFAIIIDVFFRLFARLVTVFPPPEQVSLQAHLNFYVLFLSSFILALLSIGIFIWQVITERSNLETKPEKCRQYLLFFLWFFLGIFIFGFYKKSIYDYYFEFMFPLPFIFVGNFIYFLFKQKNILKIISLVVFLVITFLNLKAMPFLSTPNRQLNQAKTIADFVLNKTNNKPFNFALISSGNSDYAYRYFFVSSGHSPVEMNNLQADPKRKSVTDQLLVVCETYPCYPLGYSLWEVAGFGRAEVSGMWDVSVVKVYKLIHYKQK